MSFFKQEKPQLFYTMSRIFFHKQSSACNNANYFSKKRPLYQLFGSFLLNLQMKQFCVDCDFKLVGLYYSTATKNTN